MNCFMVYFIPGHRLLQRLTVLSPPFLRTSLTALFTLAKYSCQHCARARDSTSSVRELLMSTLSWCQLHLQPVPP